jgi:phospholipase/carboxylesterase
MNINLTYNISLPSNVEEGKKYPVIYAMHGMGSNEKYIISVIEELKDDFIIIGIRGPLTMNSGFAYFTIKSFGNPDIVSFDEVVEKLEVFIDNAPNKYAIDASKQYLLGFSQGAILSMTLALKLGNKIKGIVALSGYIPKHVKETYKVKEVSKLSIFIAHGEFDEVFPLNIGKENYEFFKTRSELLRFNSYPIGHQISLEEKKDIIAWLGER